VAALNLALGLKKNHGYVKKEVNWRKDEQRLSFLILKAHKER